MSEEISPEQINRSFSDQVRRQQAEIERLTATLNQRSVDTVGEFIDGLDVFLKLAGAGHEPARAMLRLLLERLEAARTPGLQIVRGNGGPRSS